MSKEQPTFENSLPVALTDKEIIQHADEAADNAAEIAVKEQELATTKAHYKGVLAELDESLRSNLGFVRRKHETRTVMCEWRFDVPKKGEKSCFRLDTNEAFNVLEMTPEDLQGDLDMGDPVEEEAETAEAVH